MLKMPRLGASLLLMSLACVGLYGGGAIRNHNFGYDYMVWNLFLAWLPLLFIVWLQRTLRRKRWSSWQGITLSILWLGFLPNSFYMITDFIHLQDVPTVDVLYDSVMLSAFAIMGMILGYLSLYLFHIELRKRAPAGTTARMVGFILLLCSFAIYMGRDLRWNTWDLFINPAGILYDVSDRLINPRAYGQMFVTVVTLFVLLVALYYLIWNFIRALQSPPQR